MKKKEIEILLTLRQNLINNFDSLRDYKNNKNAIMKELDHARMIHDVIVEIDKVLKDHVEFADKK